MIQLAQLLVKTKEADAGTEVAFGKKDEGDYFVNIARAFADVADGLQHAHSKGVIHRDIKPSNLILDEEGRLRILDFGLARLEGQESITLSGDIVGTALYMSPEQARQKKIPLDHRTDIYSLGATIYETITFRPPFRGKNHQDTLSQIIERDPVEPRKVNQRVPKDLETIVLKCLRKSPPDRYGTAEALSQDLKRFVRGDPIEARAQAGWERLARRVAANRRKFAGLFILLALLTFLGILGYKLSRAERDKAHLRSLLPRDPTEVLGGFFGDLEEIKAGVDGVLFGVAVSADELTLYFSRHEGNPRSNVDIYFMTRRSKDEEFAVPAQPLDELNSPQEDWVYGNCLSPDGCEIYFTSTRPNSEGQDIWMARFKAPGNPLGGFDTIKKLGPAVNTSGKQLSPVISHDGLRLYFECKLRNICVATRKRKGDPFDNSVQLNAKLGGELYSAISPDELTLFWMAKHPQGFGAYDIWTSTRERISDEFGRPVPFENFVNIGPPVNTAASEGVPCLTADWPRPGSGLYFGRGLRGEKMFRAAWHPRPEAAASRRADERTSTEERLGSH